MWEYVHTHIREPQADTGFAVEKHKQIFGIWFFFPSFLDGCRNREADLS